MKFSYREYVSIFPGTKDYRLILRPVITIRVVGPNANARWDALVDSGADETMFPLSLADASDEVIILEHGGCLDFFTAIFDGEKAELELTPNELLPS